MSKQRGFTLIELILVVAIIAILAGLIFVALDPARRLNESRNTRRSSDVNTILDAVSKYQTDNNGVHYTPVANMGVNAAHLIGTCTSGALGTCGAKSVNSSCVDLSDIGSNYMAKVPKDPNTGSDTYTDYYISVDTNGAVTVGACDPEGEGAGGNNDAPEIEVTR